jgi:hypothetical protein
VRRFWRYVHEVFPNHTPTKVNRGQIISSPVSGRYDAAFVDLWGCMHNCRGNSISGCGHAKISVKAEL